jgi:NTP pyrophosphatase (non-canonical NTP hydrolase)
MDIKELSKIAFQFQEERNWKIKDPNHLINSIVIELGELSEHYQWKKTFEKLSEEKKKEIAFEFVDVLVYLLSLAHRSGIEDLEPYFIEKLDKLAKKWPVGTTKKEYKEKHDEYRKTGKSKLYK